MATKFELSGSPRTATGKGAARKIRAEHKLPAVLYGKGEDPMHLVLDERQFLRTVTGHSTSNMIIDLDTGNSGTVKALVREIQLDPVSQRVLHVDLNRVSMTEKIEIEVPLELVGTPIGVKDYGGILSHPIRTLTVLCLATEVPEEITVDVSKLGLNDSLYVSDLDLGGLEMVTDAETMIATVTPPMAEEVEPEPEEGAEPEVLTEKKGAEEGGEEKKGEKKPEKKTEKKDKKD